MLPVPSDLVGVKFLKLCIFPETFFPRSFLLSFFLPQTVEEYIHLDQSLDVHTSFFANARQVDFIRGVSLGLRVGLYDLRPN